MPGSTRSVPPRRQRGLRRRGRLCVLGMSGQPTLALPWDLAMQRALDVSFSLSSSWSSWDGALALLARGAVDPEPLATVFPLAGWEDAFAAIADRIRAALADFNTRASRCPNNWRELTAQLRAAGLVTLRWVLALGAALVIFMLLERRELRDRVILLIGYRSGFRAAVSVPITVAPSRFHWSSRF